MARVAKQSVYQAFDLMGQDILSADKGDGIVSRADMKDKLKELSGVRRQAADMFYRFIDHRDYKPGARVTKKDVDKALVYAKETMVRKYDLNNNGLSKAEIGKMSRTAQLAVELSREMKAREQKAGEA